MGKVSAQPVAGPLLGTEIVSLLQGGTNKQVLLSEIMKTGKGILDAPIDTKLYGRKDGAWFTITIPAAGIADAASDDGYYVRHNGGWAAAPASGISDAPNDTNSYVRKAAGWVVASTGLADAPNDANTYGRHQNTWVTLVTDAANDGTMYGRKNGNWYAIPAAGIGDAAADSVLYARKNNVWVAVPAAGIADAPSDTTYYGRHGSAWAAVVGEAPNDANSYVRKGAAWAIAAGGIADAASDGAQYIRKNGGWAPLDTYTLKVAAATTGILDLASQQVHTIANSSATTISIKAGTAPAAGRAQTIVLVINGAATITWFANIFWHGNTAPVLGATTTVVTLLWDGSRWLGIQGATF